MTQSAPLPPFLTDDELAQICEPLKMPAAQIRYLKSLGLIVNRKPNGKPLVARGEFERVLVGRAPETALNAVAAQGDIAALQQLFAKRRVKPSTKS